MKLRSRTLPPPVHNSSNLNLPHRKTSPSAYSGVDGQSQCVKSCRHNPMKSKRHRKRRPKPNHNKKAKDVTLSIICDSNHDFNTQITINVDLSESNQYNYKKSKEIKDKIEREMHKKYYPQKFGICDWGTEVSGNINGINPFTVKVIMKHEVSATKSQITLGCPLNRGEMLSLILYTGSECNWYLSEDERNHNINNDKWVWMEYCLDSAITKLHEKERGEYKIYTGLQTTNLVRNKQRGTFKTFVSASWKKEIAIDYMNNGKKNNNGGMIIEMERDIDCDGIVCADVSWISKFSDECEVLINRGTFVNLHVEDTQDNWQNVRNTATDCSPMHYSRSIAACMFI